MSKDREHDDVIPDPDAPPAAGEAARAEGFGNLVDKLVEGDALPPAMDSDDRALLEVATMVVAGTHEMELQPERRSSIIDSALERAVLGTDKTAGPKKPGVTDEPEQSDVVDLAARRESRIARAVPWVVAAVAAAAAVVLFVTRPPAEDDNVATTTTPVQVELSSIHRSRSADALVGQIPRAQSGHASARLDTIYSDRMAGYRDLSFRRRLGGGNQ